MPDELQLEGNAAAEGMVASESFWDKLAKLIRGNVRKELAEQAKSTDPRAQNAIAAAIKALQEAGDSLPEHGVAALKALTADQSYGYPPPKDEEEPEDPTKKAGDMGMGMMPEDEKKPEEKECKVPEEKALPPQLAAAQAAAQDQKKPDEEEQDMAKEDVAKSAAPDPVILGRLEALEKANTALQEELAKARAETRHQSYVAKAARLQALPTSPDELASMMEFIEKADAGVGAKFSALLEAVNNQLSDASLFVEKGSAAIPEAQRDIVSKQQEEMAKGVAPDVALLSMPAAEQAKYLADRQNVAKRGA